MAARILSVFAVIFSFSTILSAQDGVLKFYYPSGKIESEINYVKDVLNGFSTWYYENGNKRKEVFYSDGKINGWVKYYYESGLVKAEFSVKDGLRDGLTKFYYSNGALKEVRSYENGKLVKQIKLEKDNTFVPPLEAYEGAVSQIEKRKKGNNYLCDVEFCPEPIGGIKAIQKNVVYPEHARLYGLEGKVILKVYVDKLGNPQQIEVEKSLGLGCDEAAINAVRLVKFLPGQNNGQVVDAWVVISVDFKLKEEKSKLSESYKPVIDTPEFAFEDFEFDEEKSPAGIAIKELNEKNYDLYDTASVISAKTIEKVEVEEPVKKIKEEVKKEKVEEKLLVSQIQLLSCNAEICPKPKGGIKEIEKHLVVPSKVKRLKLEGTVIVEADIDEYGYVRDTKVLQKMGHGCDEAAEVAILDTHFLPAEENRKHIRTKLKIAVPFSYRN